MPNVLDEIRKLNSAASEAAAVAYRELVVCIASEAANAPTPDEVLKTIAAAGVPFDKFSAEVERLQQRLAAKVLLDSAAEVVAEERKAKAEADAIEHERKAALDKFDVRLRAAKNAVRDLTSERVRREGGKAVLIATAAPELHERHAAALRKRDASEGFKAKAAQRAKVLNEIASGVRDPEPNPRAEMGIPEVRHKSKAELDHEREEGVARAVHELDRLTAQVAAADADVAAANAELAAVAQLMLVP